MGLDIGLEQAGRFSVVAAVEQEHAFCETIRANHAAGRLPAEFRLFERDIKELDPADILEATGLRVGELDLLVGAPRSLSPQCARRKSLRCPAPGEMGFFGTRGGASASGPSSPL